ncbi:MotA/TolQ/ExbB proton channel family protein [Vibrio coralliilyticus]|uniref:MotA/TolQ/ExbB proton channel family protein n=1 Tax=Vibrio coralliilyticus TaxID=190893 RepID=UPI0017C52B5A|nr:MotA/TolQ/ExbB proton channel family protein [Vibrio coralliilyticus]NUW70133.1 MotA/TolQ/ExbB proton channel family protein [Vibrio coralliilyticus]
MYFIGLFIYAMAIFVTYYVDSAKEFFISSLELAPEITVLVSICLLYPLVLFFMLFVKKDKVSARQMFNKHSSMCSSIAVSLGLIGTFLGLVGMISSISGAFGEPSADFSKQMGTLLSSISESLASMSFAFSTSVLGVSVSSVIVIASTFLEQKFIINKSMDVSEGDAHSSKDIAYLREKVQVLTNEVNEQQLLSIENNLTNMDILIELRKLNDNTAPTLEGRLSQLIKSSENLHQELYGSIDVLVKNEESGTRKLEEIKEAMLYSNILLEKNSEKFESVVTAIDKNQESISFSIDKINDNITEAKKNYKEKLKQLLSLID